MLSWSRPSPASGQVLRFRLVIKVVDYDMPLRSVVRTNLVAGYNPSMSFMAEDIYIYFFRFFRVVALFVTLSCSVRLHTSRKRETERELSRRVFKKNCDLVTLLCFSTPCAIEKPKAEAKRKRRRYSFSCDSR